MYYLFSSNDTTKTLINHNLDYYLERRSFSLHKDFLYH